MPRLRVKRPPTRGSYCGGKLSRHKASGVGTFTKYKNAKSFLICLGLSTEFYEKHPDFDNPQLGLV
ncbi:MAG TPA: hypothetical protein VE944_07125 [Nostoc sp.]|uniref:hypothetical protein n=1 Tax=Nostoc sp. TaxID=1180 RepID=UPI002D735C52|nr:hypothetical protein [Nostoc sp.]HYX14125.1 hypothetical protein [Nostoc sp.]